MLSRILVGTRVALAVGIIPVLIALVAGVSLGLISGYFGGAIDQVVMRLIDILLAFPWLLLAIGIVAILGPGIHNVIIAVAIVYIPAFARIVRGSVLSIKEKEYVEAARSMGQPNTQIIVRHVLANAWAPIIVLSTLSIGQAIIYAAGLSFIGLGTQPPDADWGVMLSLWPGIPARRAVARLLPRSRHPHHRPGLQPLRRRPARRPRPTIAVTNGFLSIGGN